MKFIIVAATKIQFGVSFNKYRMQMIYFHTISCNSIQMIQMMPGVGPQRQSSYCTGHKCSYLSHIYVVLSHGYSDALCVVLSLCRNIKYNKNRKHCITKYFIINNIMWTIVRYKINNKLLNIFELNLHLSYIKLHENRNNLSNIKMKLKEIINRLCQLQTRNSTA